MLTKILFAIEIVVGLIVIVSILMQKSKADALSGLIQGSKYETIKQNVDRFLKIKEEQKKHY